MKADNQNNISPNKSNTKQMAIKTTLKISQIKNNPNNPRLIKDDKFKKLVASIKEFPEMLDAREIVVNKDHIILGGNMRFKAAKEAGLKEVPVKVVDWSEEKQRQFVIKDNVSGGEWDWDILANEWNAEELDAWGLDTTDDWNEPEEVVEDEAPEVDESEPPKSKLGEVYQLGRHRVFCGDSTLRTSYETLMGGKVADLVFTDPPYGMKKENDGVLNDNLNYDKLLEFNKVWIPLTFEYMKEVGSWYCWGIDEPLMDIYSLILRPMAKEQKITFRNLITWDKGHGQGQSSELTRSFATADEKCLFVMGGVQGFNNNSDNYYEGWEQIRSYLDGEMEKVGGRKAWRDALGNGMGSHYFTKSQWVFPTREAYEKLQEYGKGDAFKKDYDALKKDYDALKKEWQDTRSYFNNTHDNMNNVWHFDRTSQEERVGTGEHATPKPLALCSRAIKSSTQEGESVLDVFGGSGSTLIACEQTDRTCYMMELDPKYTDVIRKRWAKYVYGDEALENDKWIELTPVVA